MNAMNVLSIRSRGETHPASRSKKQRPDKPDNLAAKPFFLRIIGSTATPIRHIYESVGATLVLFPADNTLQPPDSFRLRPSRSVAFSLSSFFSTRVCSRCLASPKSAVTDSFEGMTFVDRMNPRNVQLLGRSQRGKIRSPCKTISPIETFVTRAKLVGSLIPGTRLISESRERNECGTRN